MLNDEPSVLMMIRKSLGDYSATFVGFIMSGGIERFKTKDRGRFRKNRGCIYVQNVQKPPKLVWSF